MKRSFLATLAALNVVCGCSADTAASAASGAVIKKQELEQAQKTLEQSKAKIDQAMQLQRERAEQAQ